jgi:hypothetical protein
MLEESLERSRAKQLMCSKTDRKRSSFTLRTKRRQWEKKAMSARGGDGNYERQAASCCLYSDGGGSPYCWVLPNSLGNPETTVGFHRIGSATQRLLIGPVGRCRLSCWTESLSRCFYNNPHVEACNTLLLAALY